MIQFFKDFGIGLFEIGKEFVERFSNIPSNLGTVGQYLPIALIGICVVMLELVLVACMILLLSKVVRSIEGRKKAAPEQVAAVPSAVACAPAGVPLPDGQSAGTLDLVDVDEPTAAVIMAIVSDQSGIPLNRLNFKSIKRVEDK